MREGNNISVGRANNSMSRKFVLYSICGVLVLIGAFAIYGWVDTALSLDHARQQEKTQQERSQLLSEMLLASKRGAKRSDVLQFVKQNLGSGHIIKEEQDRIMVDGVVFRFDNSQLLAKVQFLDEMGD